MFKFLRKKLFFKITLLTIALATITLTFATSANDTQEEKLVTAEVTINASLVFEEDISPNSDKQIAISEQTSIYKNLSRWGWDSDDTSQSIVFGENSIYDSVIQKQIDYLAAPILSKSIFREIFKVRNGWRLGPDNCLAFSYSFTLWTNKNDKIQNITKYSSNQNETLYLFPGFIQDSSRSFSLITSQDIENILTSMFYRNIGNKLHNASYENYQKYNEHYNISTKGILYHHENVTVEIHFQIKIESMSKNECVAN